MVTDTTDDVDFQDSLEALLRTAAARDVDVTGSWECRDGEDDPAWEVEVVRLADAPRMD